MGDFSLWPELCLQERNNTVSGVRWGDGCCRVGTLRSDRMRSGWGTRRHGHWSTHRIRTQVRDEGRRCRQFPNPDPPEVSGKIETREVKKVLVSSINSTSSHRFWLSGNVYSHDASLRGPLVERTTSLKNDDRVNGGTEAPLRPWGLSRSSWDDYPIIYHNSGYSYLNGPDF